MLAAVLSGAGRIGLPRRAVLANHAEFIIGNVTALTSRYAT
jgi:hypothetical protein